jgi:hypothetical protein
VSTVPPLPACLCTCRYYVTPKSFLDLVASFKALLADKRGELAAARDRLLNGVAKLRETNAQVRRRCRTSRANRRLKAWVQ